MIFFGLLYLANPLTFYLPSLACNMRFKVIYFTSFSKIKKVLFKISDARSMKLRDTSCKKMRSDVPRERAMGVDSNVFWNPMMEQVCAHTNQAN